jgi:predicted oxidoreductase
MEKLITSPLIAGTMKWGTWGAKMTQVDMSRYIEHCLSLGIHTFDCAAIYGGYTTESEFGSAMSDLRLDRNDFQVLSKCGIEYPSAENPVELKHYDYTLDAILASVERSLERLKVDTLDLLLLHRPSPLMDPEVVAAAVGALKKNGKIRAFGVSNFSTSTLALLDEQVAIDANQIQCSLTHLEPFADGTLDYHMQKKIATQCWNPLGTLFSEKGDRETRIVDVATSLSKKYGVSLNALFIAWLMKHPARLVPVVGTSNQLHLSEMALSSQVEMEQMDWFRLFTASTGVDVP